MWSLRTWAWKPSGVVSRFVRKVRTASGAVAVQVVTRRGRQAERIEHVGSAHTDAELALLLAVARERLSPGQDVLDLGDLPVVPARMDEVADWTGEPELPLQTAKPAAGGRPVSVAAGGRVVGTVKRNRFIQLSEGTHRVNRELEAKARALAGVKGYADVLVMPNCGGSGPGDARVWGGLIGIMAGRVAVGGLWPS
jgi:hypothetical protein